MSSASSSRRRACRRGSRPCTFTRSAPAKGRPSPRPAGTSTRSASSTDCSTPRAHTPVISRTSRSAPTARDGWRHRPQQVTLGAGADLAVRRQRKRAGHPRRARRLPHGPYGELRRPHRLRGDLQEAAVASGGSESPLASARRVLPPSRSSALDGRVAPLRGPSGIARHADDSSRARRKRARLRTGVVSPGTDEAVVGVLLHGVGAPSGDAADGEDRRAQVRRDVQRVVDDGREEIDVHGQTGCGRASCRRRARRPRTAAGDRWPRPSTWPCPARPAPARRPRDRRDARSRAPGSWDRCAAAG